MNIILFDKLEDGTLRKINERPWDDKLIASLEAANYLVIGGQEYEMIEGRLNLDLDQFELLLAAAETKESKEKE
jgi:hypothetical protein